MKRYSWLLLIIVLLLCQFSSVFSNGALGDMDAFKTYIDRTRSEVRRIAPMFEEMEDDIYVVDYILEDDEMIAIGVTFDEYNLVDKVLYLITNGALEKLDLSDDLMYAAAVGITGLGFDSDDVLRTSTDDDNIVFYIRGGITVGAMKMSDRLYGIVATQR